MRWCAKNRRSTVENIENRHVCEAQTGRLSDVATLHDGAPYRVGKIAIFTLERPMFRAAKPKILPLRLD